MNKKVIRICLVVAVGFLPLSDLAAENQDATLKKSIPLNTDVNIGFQEKIPVWLAENNVPAVGIGLIENGKIKYVKVFGELKKGVPAPDNAIFNVASITKPVVAMLTLKLVETGQWDLDEPLANYWVDPDVANDPRHKKLTTRHVLCHQTGFPNWRSQKLTFDFEPGTNYQYSGEGFEYLRHALERKFNKSLVELSDSILFKPLGMKDSRFYWDTNMDESRFAFWHDSKGNLLKPATPKGGGANAAGSLLATIEDFCRFSVDVINGAGLSPNIYNDMINPRVNIREHYAKGLGWGVVKDLPNGEYALEHSGTSGGVKTMFVLLPKSKRGIVVLTNGDNGVFVYNNVIKESLDIGQTVLDYLNGSYAHKIATLSDEILGKYVGTYIDSYGRNLAITKEDGALKISGNGVPTVKLCPEAENKFFLKEFDVQFEFAENDSFTITANGKVDCTAKKVNHPQIVKLTDDISEKYVGTYSRSDNNSNLFVAKEGDSLKLSGETVPLMELCPIAENRFFAKGLGYQFEFVKDESDKVIKMNVTGNGKVLCEAKRIK
jgi:CubicO group peptidase (beta-lactamase class C family)